MHQCGQTVDHIMIFYAVIDVIIILIKPMCVRQFIISYIQNRSDKGTPLRSQ